MRSVLKKITTTVYMRGFPPFFGKTVLIITSKIHTGRNANLSVNTVVVCTLTV